MAKNDDEKVVTGVRFLKDVRDPHEGIEENEMRLAMTEEGEIALIIKGKKPMPLFAKLRGHIPKNAEEANSREFALRMAMACAVGLMNCQQMLRLFTTEEIGAKVLEKIQADVERKVKAGKTDELPEAMAAAMMVAAGAMAAAKANDDEEDEPEQKQSGPSAWPNSQFTPKRPQ